MCWGVPVSGRRQAIFAWLSRDDKPSSRPTRKKSYAEGFGTPRQDQPLRELFRWRPAGRTTFTYVSGILRICEVRHPVWGLGSLRPVTWIMFSNRQPVLVLQGRAFLGHLGLNSLFRAYISAQAGLARLTPELPNLCRGMPNEDDARPRKKNSAAKHGSMNNV